MLNDLDNDCKQKKQDCFLNKSSLLNIIYVREQDKGYIKTTFSFNSLLSL